MAEEAITPSLAAVAALSRIERATREPRIGTLARLTEGLGISLSQLVGLGTALPVSRRYRADVEGLAELLDDKPAPKVKFIVRFARMYLDEQS